MNAPAESVVDATVTAAPFTSAPVSATEMPAGDAPPSSAAVPETAAEVSSASVTAVAVVVAPSEMAYAGRVCDAYAGACAAVAVYEPTCSAGNLKLPPASV